MSKRGAAGRVKFDADSAKYGIGSGSSITRASPEVLYAAGRITAARYHQMLAEMDERGGDGDGDSGGGDGSGGGAAGCTGVGISRLRGAAPTATLKVAAPSQSNVGGVRRRTDPVLC